MKINVLFLAEEGTTIGNVDVRDGRDNPANIGNGCLGEPRIANPGKDGGGIWTFEKSETDSALRI